MKRAIVTVCVCLMIAGFAIAAEKDGVVQLNAAQRSTGTPDAVPEATAFIVYDDGTFETNSAAVIYGNKFVSSGPAWGTFYCDQLSFYVDVVSASNFWLTAYRTLNTAGTDLGSPDFFLVGGITATGWWFIDGSTTPADWIGNTGVVFTDTAWIGADNASADYLGVDTSTTAGHAFTITSWSGATYTEVSGANAGLRPRLNGDNVPVELQAFTIE